MENNKKIVSFLTSEGFKLIDGEVSPYFGDYLFILANDVMKIRFSRDRSFESIDLSSIEDGYKWYDLDLVKMLLNNSQEQNTIRPIDEIKEFLEKDFFFIIELFAKKDFYLTKKRLEDLREMRAKQMFPGMM